MPRLSGSATPVGTAAFARRAVETRRLPAEHFRTAPGALVLSSLGLGTYIGRPDASTDAAVEQAVALSVSSGRVNVLDTAINYRYQRAERSVGRALRRQIDEGAVARDEVFIATKNGYFAPDAESGLTPSRWIETELVRPGILDLGSVVDGCHSMAPGYLADQFARSRENLGVDVVDLLYLHNAADAQLAVVGPEEFDRRLRAAFTLYERFRSEGSLGAYGLATWDCLRRPPDAPGHLSLESAVESARAVGGPSHGFRFVQFPFNLSMPEACTVRNQMVRGKLYTLFEAADRLGLGCFTSVPLLQGQLARAGPARDGLSPAQTALQWARSVPGTIGPLVGQKSPEHLRENLEVASRPPWAETRFRGILS